MNGATPIHLSMFGMHPVVRHGSEEMKRKYLPDVASGKLQVAFGVTEPDAGSAASEMTTRADKKGDKWIVNGKKHWITGGGVSKMHLIFARLEEDGEDQGIAGFLAFRDEDEGLVIGKREPAMGLRGIPETAVHFQDLKLDADRIVVPPEGTKRGFAGLMNAYNSQRVGAATVALGIAQGAFDQARAFAKERQQFGRPLAEFQGLQWMFADMSVALNAARMMIWRAAASAEQTASGFPDPLMAAEAKILASETAIKVTNDALQIHGAMGYSRNLPLERMARDARMFTIGGGTAQVLRNLVASKILNRKLPQTRDGYLNMPRGNANG